MHDPALWITSWVYAFGVRISPYFKNPARRSALADSPQNLVATGRGARSLCRIGSVRRAMTGESGGERLCLKKISP